MKLIFPTQILRLYKLKTLEIITLTSYQTILFSVYSLHTFIIMYVIMFLHYLLGIT